LALDAEHVATSQVVGQQADLTLYDYERSRLATSPQGLPAGATLDDGDVVVASIDGAVSRFGAGDESADQVGSIGVPAGGEVRGIPPRAGGGGIVVLGGGFEAAVALDGHTLFTTTFTAPVDEPRIEPDWTCVPIGGGAAYPPPCEHAPSEQGAPP